MKVGSFDDFMRPVDEVELEMRALSARMLERIAELDAEWVDDSAIPDIACEISARHGITASLASERLRVARVLRDLPEIRRAHAKGRLSWDQVRWVTKFATPETDDEWSERAASMRPGALQLEAQRQAASQRLRAERDHAARSLRMDWDDDRRFLYLQGCLAAEQGAAVEASLHRAAQHIDLGDEAVVDRRGARLADALVELVTSSGGRAQAPTLVVHADVDVLARTRDGERHLAETSSGVQLCDDAIRRIACDTRVQVALERNGLPAGLVTTGRVVTEHQMQMLRFRDRHCMFPGCERTWFLHAHHIRHWADGGPTTLDNLTLLCGNHHRRVHDGGWTIRGRPPDELRFVDGLGRVRRRSVPELARAG